MNAVTSLESMGLSLSLSATGKLAVEGLKRLSQKEREYACHGFLKQYLESARKRWKSIVKAHGETESHQKEQTA
jgi:hypothetical protein